MYVHRCARLCLLRFVTFKGNGRVTVMYWQSTANSETTKVVCGAYWWERFTLIFNERRCFCGRTALFLWVYGVCASSGIATPFFVFLGLICFENFHPCARCCILTQLCD